METRTTEGPGDTGRMEVEKGFRGEGKSFRVEFLEEEDFGERGEG